MIRVIHHMCQPWLYKKSECRLCVDACPVAQCIQFVDKIQVDNEKCISCGICTTICPTSALVFEGLSDGELFDRLKTSQVEGSLLFGCTLGQNETDRSMTARSGTLPSGKVTPINLPCLAILKEAHLAALILSGIEEVYLDLSLCSGCTLTQGRNTIDMKIMDETSSAEKTKKGRRVKVKEIVPGPEYSRREMFFFLKQKAGEKAKERVFGRNNNGTETVIEEQGMPERRMVLVDALKDESIGLDPTARLIEGTFPAHNAGILETCTMCGKCEAFCPTGAFKSVEGDGEVTIEFRMNYCMGCYQCKELCPEGAIYYEEEMELERLAKSDGDGLKALIKRQRLECTKCRRKYFPEVHLDGCPSCKKKKGLDERIGQFLYGKAWDKEKTVSGKDIT
jgi:formate hydrogenlyase subunit 6/NADH:ubiquinone oxidoreductase subunit I